MNPLLEQFLSEARDFLQGIGEKLMALEATPSDAELVTELFRLVHTLKGNSGLFTFPTMTRVLHAAEDLMVEIRTGQVPFSRAVADALLNAMDFVATLCDELDSTGTLEEGAAAGASVQLAANLRRLLPTVSHAEDAPAAAAPPDADLLHDVSAGLALDEIPEAARLATYQHAGNCAILIRYRPAEGCFYQGEDPFHQARQTPGLQWGRIVAREPWPRLETLDAYRCALDFQMLSTAPRAEIEHHFRYQPEQIDLVELSPLDLAVPTGNPNGGPVYEDFVEEALRALDAGRLADLSRGAKALLELSSPALWLSSALRWLLAVMAREPENRAAFRAIVSSLRVLQPPRWSEVRRAAVDGGAPVAGQTSVVPSPAAPHDPIAEETALRIIAVQRQILALPGVGAQTRGRNAAATATLAACLRALGRPEAVAAQRVQTAQVQAAQVQTAQVQAAQPAQSTQTPGADTEVRFGRRAEDTVLGAKSLKVDQAKIDRLMNLIGEMVVSKNALPYLAGRAETVYGSREFAREIKSQYAVINRIAEEMQDAIMQVRMMPVSFVFQRFPRLVRDISHKLGKRVDLELQGEDTEADKNIIEALGDPLVHLVRNSLDHAFESPEGRAAAGKPAAGRLTLRASQESDRVLIQIEDDGKGIDPQVIKRKAYERGVIDEATLERISDQEAVNLIFAPGLSTAETVSDLSGRGVGMDAVRSAVEKANGTVHVHSVLGQGTRVTLSLPLSMAVTDVMIVDTDGQTFGFPMDTVIETVRLHPSRITGIKNSQATVLRGRLVALKSLNSLLGLPAAPKTNADGELAVLVVRVGDEPVGLIVDQFHEVVDVILKPMAGVLGRLSAYAGSALMGDGSVLMVLNVKELL